MRDAKPGMKEYELQADAEFVFKKWGAYGPSYFALIATGPNTYYSHYHKNTDTLKDGDLVQFDYAPDYKYYQSDVTRVFPAGGRFTPRQREFYTIYLKLYQSVMTSIRVHASAQDILKDAVAKMDGIMASFTFTDSKIKDAATAFVENYRRSATTARSLGHDVGMEVHDVTGGVRRSREDLHHRARDADRRRTPRPPARGHDPDHRNRLREPVGVRAGRDRRDRKPMKEPGLSDAMMNDTRR